MRIGIQQKIGAVLALLVAISLGIIGLAYTTLENIHDVADKSANLFLELQTVNKLHITLERRVSPAKLALTSGSSTEQQAFKQGLGEIYAMIDELKQTPTVLSRERRVLQGIHKHIKEIEALADRTFFARPPVGVQAKSAAAKTIERHLSEINRLLDRWRRLDQKEVETGLLKAHAVHRIKRDLLIGSLLILVIGGAISFSVARFISKPLLQLHEGVEKIGRGDLAYTFKIQTGDEIQDLAEAFNRLAYNLRQEEETASDIQRRLLPQDDLRAPGVRVYARQIHAKLVGGDWFDYYQFEDEVRLLIADASGKGMPGADHVVLPGRTAAGC